MIPRPFFGNATVEHPACLQDKTELDNLIALLTREKVRNYLEIGARYGGTFEAVMTALRPGSHGMAIDLPGGHFGDAKSEPILRSTVERLKLKGCGIDIIFGSSASPLVVRRARANAPFGAILIDADHSYEAVSRDFELYSPMGRIIVLHDIAAPEGFASKAGHKVEVPRFWNEIKGHYRHEEILATNTLMGIGVLFMDERK